MRKELRPEERYRIEKIKAKDSKKAGMSFPEDVFCGCIAEDGSVIFLFREGKNYDTDPKARRFVHKVTECPEELVGCRGAVRSNCTGRHE